MKYVAFLLAAGFGVPLGALFLKCFPRWHGVWTAAVLFLTVKTVDINFWSRRFYRGTSRGFEVSLVDLMMLSMALYLLLYRRQTLRWWPRGSVWYSLFFLGSVVSLSGSDIWLYSGFELLKMLRMYLMFWVMYQWLQDPALWRWVYHSMGIVMAYIFLTMLQQKYLMGIWQARGPFPHQNSLMMYTNLLNCLLFSHALNLKQRSGQSLLAFVYVGMGVLCTLFTFSRGGLMFLGVGLMLVLCISLRPREISLRKLTVLGMMALAGAGIAYKAADSVLSRFETAPKESMEVREVLAVAALNMVADKPLGVGLNQFGLKINPPYPYGNHIPRKEPGPYEEEEKGGLVETVYLMIAAESGWHTLVAYLIFVWGFAGRAFWLYCKTPSGVIKYWSLGLSCGLTCILLNSCFEWVLKQSNNFYQLMMVFALILALQDGAKYNVAK